jgi:hypothetical protein
MSALGYRELEESANAALTRFYNRTGWEMGWENGRQVPVQPAMTFHEALSAEDDGENSETVGEYELRQRMVGARGLFRFLMAHGPLPSDMLKQLADAGRSMHIPPFNIMTMEEQAGLFGQGKAAVSFRNKVLSREIRLSGMKADKVPGQKSKAASESYRQREIAKKDKPHRPRSRQKSFLRQLHVAPRRKSKSGSQEARKNGGQKAA